jgi:cytochrome b subunit of formate dehydrogenase
MMVLFGNRNVAELVVVGGNALDMYWRSFFIEIYAVTPAIVSEVLHCFLQSLHEFVSTVHPSASFMIPHVSYTDDVW